MPLTPEQLDRYSRHLLLPEIGREGQERLLRAKVLIVGVGGLGSPASLYLAGAGVGTIGLVDQDRVERSNLQRQILYNDSDIGRVKLEAAGERLKGFNPDLVVNLHETRLTERNAEELIRPYDLVIGATDSLVSRYAINEACVHLGKPNIYGAVFEYEGQASVFLPKESPCYRCLYPELPPPEAKVAGGGILGILPGVIGTIQATEAIKIVIGKGDLLTGRLILYNALQMKFREIPIRRNPTCPVCGEKAAKLLRKK